ncbi:Zn-ribbon domain-containing OB-fold protein [Cupriavidus sp. NPDC089707]|uniref:Zn-ribbon domain-containing OB-fold protein n=1 Tax=Cupriavidus sp. NPDC089707 TaxID=3363963 RepID=UPI00380FF9F9
MTQTKSGPAKPVPVPQPVTRPFWEGTAAGELRLQQCGGCQELVFYPRAHCPACGSEDLNWTRASGRATLHSYVISHMAMPGWQGETPYVIAIVQLQEGPRMMSNLVGVPADPTRLTLDMPLEVVFEPRGEMALPQFRPAGAATGSAQ